MSMWLEGSLVGFLCIKAELFKVIQSVWGIDRASHTKKNGVKDNFLGLHPVGSVHEGEDQISHHKRFKNVWWVVYRKR